MNTSLIDKLCPTQGVIHWIGFQNQESRLLYTQRLHTANAIINTIAKNIVKNTAHGAKATREELRKGQNLDLTQRNTGNA